MTLSKIRIRVGKGPDAIDLGAKQAGQIIVIFALSLTALIGLVGIAIDVTYAWRNALQIQRAADAAAMAGVVYLPGDVGTATSRADAIALSNGYSASNGSTISVAPNPADTHQLDVTVTSPVPTFFIRLFGINQWTISRSARAAYMMPVPMGSPLSYYGVGCLVLKGVSPPACNSSGTGDSGISGGGYSSLGAWGAVISKGGNAENGDAYSPQFNRSYTNPNPLYDANGYFYTVNLPSGGTIHLYDPGFCEMGSTGSNGNYYGTGDHWIAADDNNSNAWSPMSTYYQLWDTHNQPLNPTAWTVVSGSSSGTTFESQHGQDSANTGGTEHGSGACDAYHDNWNYQVGGSLAAGSYELQVQTTDSSDSSSNLHTNAENMWAISASNGGTVYGQNRMCVYNNLAGGVQQFYMAKVDMATGIGKTLQIDLFDIGDSTAGSFSILSPDGGSQHTATFNYTTSSECVAGKSDACSGTGRTSITVKTASGSSFNSAWIHISVPLGNNYGTGGLWQGGWWQVVYNVTGGNDTTTWSVNVVGNPVHLVPLGM